MTTALESLSPQFYFLIDSKHTTKDVITIRSPITSENEAVHFVKAYSAADNSAFIYHFSNSRPQRMCFRKNWICQHSTRKKSEKSKRNAECNASIAIKIKKINRHTKRNDEYLNQSPPLPCVITIVPHHSHNTECPDGLRMLRVTAEVKKQFFDYFMDGLCASEAKKLHQDKIMASSPPQKLANAATNPTNRQVAYMFDQWRKEDLGPSTNPCKKLKEKSALCEEEDITRYSDISIEVFKQESIKRGTVVKSVYEQIKPEVLCTTPNQNPYYFVWEAEDRSTNVFENKNEFPQIDISKEECYLPLKRKHVLVGRSRPLPQCENKDNEIDLSTVLPKLDPPIEISAITLLNSDFKIEFPEDLSSLTISEVADCLQKLNLGMYVEEFAENQIDGLLLQKLDEDILKNDFNFKAIQVKKLLLFINGWRPK